MSPVRVLLLLAVVVGTTCGQETRLAVGSDGALFTVKERASSTIPGSDKRAEVFVDDIFGGWVWFVVRTVDGETLAPRRRIYLHDEAVFWIGDEEYAIRAERVRRGSVDLRVTKRWSPGTSTMGPEPPPWFKVRERIERNLTALDGHLKSAQALLGEGNTTRAREAVEAATARSEETRGELLGLRSRPSVRIGPDGTRFPVKERECVPVPGSRGWLEVVLDDIHGSRVRVGVRTAGGDTLAFPRSVVAGERVLFRLGTDAYAIEIARIDNRLLGRDSAALP